MKYMLTDRKLHPMAQGITDSFRAKRLSRREFMAQMAALGVSTTGALALGGIASPAKAEATPMQGGTLRIGMTVKPFRDPRTFDGTEMANISRQCNEYLVRWTSGFAFEPWLLEAWDASDDAKTLTLQLRPGVTWSNGDAFTAEDVIHNITRWCDGNVEGNSMAGRMGSLVDPDTKTAVVGGIEKLDDLTVRLNLPQPDISLIAGMADYPGLIMHRSYDGSADPMEALAITTGPCELVAYNAADNAEVKRKDRWWKGSYWLDGVKWIDLGTDQTTTAAAFESGEIDANYESAAELLPIFESAGGEINHIATGSTIVARMNVQQEPFTDVRIRRAVQLAVDNAVVLEIGMSGAGVPAENHHIGPMHEEYADIGPALRDDAASQALMAEAGFTGEIELITIDEDWQMNTGDAIAAQMRDSGLSVKRTVIPGSSFWNDWTKYPFSMTEWNGRPLGVQVLSLAYKSGAAWNESAYSNPEFDDLLTQALATPEVEARRALMARIEKIFRDDGVIVQPYWRSIYRSNRPGVKGYGAHQAFEQHLDTVWIEA